jgi:hypothetical protein
MNPIVQTKVTADPAPVVFKDTRTDLVNWSDHGIVMNSSVSHSA